MEMKKNWTGGASLAPPRSATGMYIFNFYSRSYFPFSQTVEGSMSDATTLSTPQDQVEALIRQVAAENDLQIEDQLAELNPAAGSLRAPGSATASKEDALERRLVKEKEVKFLRESGANANSHFHLFHFRLAQLRS